MIRTPPGSERARATSLSETAKLIVGVCGLPLAKTDFARYIELPKLSSIADMHS